VAEPGLLMISWTTAAAPEEKVVMRKTWMTWKAMYQFWVFNSTAGRVNSPLSFAIPLFELAVSFLERRANLHLQTIGTNAISTESRIEGSNPVTTPRITLGMSSMKCRKGTSAISLVWPIAIDSEIRTLSQIVDVANSTNNCNWD
jgi:hypothetical protein